MIITNDDIYDFLVKEIGLTIKKDRMWFKKPLTLSLTSMELVNIFFKLMEKYSISFEKEDISGFGFLTIEGITDKVNSRINKKSMV